jgi:hypothetical protein
MKLRAIIAAVLFSTQTLACAHAAEVSCDPGKGGHFVLPKDEKDQAVYSRRWPAGERPTERTCACGLISGPIEQGDYEKVLGLYRQNHPFLGSFTLSSPGGNVLEALKIGRFFRKYLIIAFAPVRIPSPDGGEKFVLPGEPACDGGKCLCASACALIWFGAVDRWGTVGLHRPHTDDPSFKALDPPAAAVAYRGMLDSMRQYLDEMEVPKPMIDVMVATGSADIQWITVADDLSRPPSLAEWEDATCGTFPAKERILLAQLRKKRADLTQQERKLGEKLLEKQAKWRRCQVELLASKRDKLPPP